VLIHSNGSVYISDHGLCPAGARTIGPRSHSYLAPEVVATGEPTACSDVYALGALLYVGICGRYPLPLTGRVEVDHTILREHKLLPPPSGVKLHGRIGQVIWRALQPCPEDRFASAREVLIALEELSTLASKGALLSRLLRR
jgi:serine/threonine-protein kinase